MSNTPTTTNTTEIAADTIITNANSAIVKVLQVMITADIPFLGWPVVSTVFGYVLGWFDGYLIKAEQTGLTFTINAADTASENTAMSTAIAALAAAQKSGDPNAIQAATKQFLAAQSALANDDGSAPVS